MKDLPVITQAILAVTGLIGTFGGVAISYITLHHTFLKDKLRIKLELGRHILITPQPGNPKPKFSKEMLTFKVINYGEKPYTIAGLGIKVGNRSGGLWINQPFGTVTIPYELKPSETCNFWTEFKKTEKNIKKSSGWHNKIKIRAYVQDYMGNDVNSNWMTVRFVETKLDKYKAMLKDILKQTIKFFLP